MSSSSEFEIRQDDHGVGQVFWLKKEWKEEYLSIFADKKIEALRVSGIASIKNLDLSFLENLPLLRSLEVYDWDIVFDLQILKYLPLLEVIGLQTKRIKKTNEIELNHLRVAKLTWSKGLDPLLQNSSLEYLNIQNFPFENLTELSRLKSLRRLHLTSRKLISLKGIEMLGALEELDLYDCRRLESDEGLSQLKNLRKIEIEACNKLKRN